MSKVDQEMLKVIVIKVYEFTHTHATSRHNKGMSVLCYLFYIENCDLISVYKERKVAKIRKRCNQVPHLTQGTTSESDKNTIKHHKPEPRGQPFPSR